MEKNSLTYEFVAAAYQRKRYRFFASGPYDLNLFAIRNGNRDFRLDAFDDLVGVAYLDYVSRPCVQAWSCTTDPGLTHITHPVFAEAIRAGAAFIAPGQYRQAFRVGYHGAGTYRHEALIQCAAMDYYRVKDADGNIPDLEKMPRANGIYATNIHHAWPSGVPSKIGNASAGCVVLQRAEDLAALVRLARMQNVHNFGSLVTFTLFNESEVWT